MYAHTGGEGITALPIGRLRDGPKVSGVKPNAAVPIGTGAELGQEKVTLSRCRVHHRSSTNAGSCGKVYGRGRQRRAGEQPIYVAFRRVIVGRAPGIRDDEQSDDGSQ